MKAEIEKPRTPLQTNMIYALDRALNGAFAVQQVLDERKVEKFELVQGEQVVFQADRQMQAMLAGGAQGAYNELVHPINRNGNRSTNRTFKALADGIIKRTKNTVFDY